LRDNEEEQSETNETIIYLRANEGEEEEQSEQVFSNEEQSETNETIISLREFSVRGRHARGANRVRTREHALAIEASAQPRAAQDARARR